MAVQRRARQVTGEDEIDEAGSSGGGSFPWLRLREMDHTWPPREGRGREEQAGFLWQDRSDAEGCQ